MAINLVKLKGLSTGEKIADNFGRLEHSNGKPSGKPSLGGYIDREMILVVFSYLCLCVFSIPEKMAQ